MKAFPSFHCPRSSKLALALLALPYCGSLAAYNHSSTLTDATTLSTNLVTKDTLAATGLDAVGTAEAPNTNYIGWANTPTKNVYLYWNTTGLSTTSGTLDSLVIGGAVTATSSASSSFNSLTIDDYLEINVQDISIGSGSLGTGDLASTVDVTKPANNNALTFSGAAYYPTLEGFVRTMLITDGDCDIGGFGNHNSVSVSGGGYLSVYGIITLGTSDKNNPDYGCDNALSVSGSVISDILNFTDSAKSTVSTLGLVVGDYGSRNTASFSDNALLSLPGTDTSLIKVGVHGDSNRLTITDSAISLKNYCTIGAMPGASKNCITLTHSIFQNPVAAPFVSLLVGQYGDENRFLMTDSTLKTNSIIIGLGDDSVGDAALDGTSNYEVEEGCSNLFKTEDSLIRMNNTSSIMLGQYGSRNEATFICCGIYSAWTDAATAENPDGDGKVQYSEITAGIADITIGKGRYNATIENSAFFGSSNNMTLSDTAAVTDTLNVGLYGSVNTLTLRQGSVLHVKQTVTIGEGGDPEFTTGMGNTIAAYDEGTLVKVENGLSMGHYGSHNILVVTGGADAVIKSNLILGEGVPFSAEIDNTLPGAANLLGAIGEGSTISIESSNPVYIGKHGSANRLALANKALCTIDADDIILGDSAAELGNVLESNKVYSEYNRISVSSATFRTNALITVGNLGCNNGLSIYGEDSYAEIGGLVIGQGNTDSPAFGSGNEVRVRDGAVLVTGNLSVGAKGSGRSSDNSLQLLDGAVVVVNGSLRVNSTSGSNNHIAIRNSIIALKGKGPGTGISWEDVIINGYSNIGNKPAPTTSLVDAGAILVWNFTANDLVTATKADLTLTYYSSEADALKATGYAGLAGYTILKQSNDLSRLSWAGDVYDGGNGSYCSSWYGWFYNDAAYGDYIFSYNNYAWQYVDPSSTVDDVWIYDYSLSTWFYTNIEYFQDHWIYNCETSTWQKLYE
jgi:hypothetical protein